LFFNKSIKQCVWVFVVVTCASKLSAQYLTIHYVK
jgi:hypothetical protein